MIPLSDAVASQGAVAGMKITGDVWRGAPITDRGSFAVALRQVYTNDVIAIRCQIAVIIEAIAADFGRRGAGAPRTAGGAGCGSDGTA